MKRNLLYALWGVLFILCAGLGFIPEPEGILGLVLTLCSLFFFLPPAIVLYQAQKSRDTETLLLIRNLSVLSLGLTLVLLILNFFTAFSSEFLGQVMYSVLVIISSPMVCSGHWAMSLFLWACLLTVSRKLLKR